MKRLGGLVIGWLVAAGAWADSTVVCRVEADVVPSAVIHSNRYLQGHNPLGEQMNTACTGRLKLAVTPAADSLGVAASYGVGVGAFAMNRQLGHPWAVYLLQEATIARLSDQWSLNYELNLGLAFGWKPYAGDNEENHVLGSRTNAYIGADLFFRYHIGPYCDLNVGFGYAHFSNANLEMPNEGLNTVGLRASVAYYLDRNDRLPKGDCLRARPLTRAERWATDVLVYGGWKRKSLALPETFGVAGFQISPMYRLNRALAVGPSLDGVYDHSIHLDVQNERSEAGTLVYRQPSWSRQVALGVQVRAELQMPVLRVSAGAGRYLLGGFTGFYETLAMKADVNRRWFLQVGYCLYNYYYSNNLMLGIGYRLKKT